MPLRRRRGRPGSNNVGVNRSLSSDGITDLLAAGVSWHREIVQAAHTGDWHRLERLWRTLRHQEDMHHMLLQQQQQKSFWSSPKRASRRELQRHHSSDNVKNSIWNRITNRGHGAATSDSALNSETVINSERQQLPHLPNDVSIFSQSLSIVGDDPACSGDVTDHSRDTDDLMNHDGSMGLLSVDEELRTPLHLLLTVPTSPTSLILKILKQEPRASTQQTIRGRLPLHLAIVYRAEDTKILEALVEAFPAAISVSDRSGGQLTPLQYAMEFAIEAAADECSDSGNENVPPPRTFWAPYDNSETESEAAIWQQQQTARWYTVHWLLLASATHPQTCLSIGGRKPMLVDALMHAAPPTVVQLLLGASITLLSHKDAATAFAGTTLYTCIARHYPLSILQSLARQCPRDAARTRDATGTGLVAALYICGCFVRTNTRIQEWTVVEDFVAALRLMLQTGRFPGSDGNSRMLRDWWSKMEFLLAFCAHQEPEGRSAHDETEKSRYLGDHVESSPLLKQFLLHAALTNSDVPPLVIRLLLSLYPESIHQTDPLSGALPLHLVAQCREYIPKSFEVMASVAHRQNQQHQQQPTGSDTFGDRSSVLKIILDADPRAVLRRHNDRLPLHYAIAAGRKMETLEPMLKQAEELINFNHSRHLLLQRDPQTGLFPFQLAACFEPNEEDKFRWTCTARNQYTNAVWQGLGEKHKATAVAKVIQRERLGRLDTVYKLLRRLPCAIFVPELTQQSRLHTKSEQRGRGAQRRQSNDSAASASSSLESSLGENISARSLYLDWCFTAKDTISGTRVYTPNEDSQIMLLQAVELLSNTGSHNLLPDFFDTWWNAMKVCLRNECRLDKYPMFGRLTMGRRMTIPVRGEEFLLHAALANFDTPPEVIKIILAFDSSAASLYLPGTYLLPLHIVSGTPSYVPRTFERVEKSSLELVLQKHPAAVRISCLGRLPLHLAIVAKKPFCEVRSLVKQEPLSLKKRDPWLGLYPFLLAAARHDGESTFALTTDDQQLQLERLAQNQNNWDSLGTEERSKQMRQVHADSERDNLSTVFFLLRQDVSVLVDNFDFSALENPLKVINVDLHNSTSLLAQQAKVQDSLRMSNMVDSRCDSIKEGNDECSASSSESFMSRRESSLMLLLKPSRGKMQQHDEVYECDASVISMVDILSSLNSTIHKSSRDDGTLTSDESNNSSIDGFSFAQADDESHYKKFAGGTVADTTCEENETKETERMSDDDEADSFVSFEIRKVSRFLVTKIVMDEGEGFSDMQSSHLSGTAHNAKGHQSDKSFASATSIISGKSTLHSEPSRFSFKCARPEKPGLTDMMWMSPELLQPRILTELSQREEDEAKITMALPPKPSSLHSKPRAAMCIVARQTSGRSPSNHSKDSKTRSSLLGEETNSDEEEEVDDGVNLALFGALPSVTALPRRPTHSNASPAHTIYCGAHASLDASAERDSKDSKAYASVRSDSDHNMLLHRSSALLHESDNSFQVNEALGATLGNAYSDSESAPGADFGTVPVSEHVEFHPTNKPYFFDCVAFKWTMHPMNQQVDSIRDVRSSSETLTTMKKHEMTFDRKSMRWVTKTSLEEKDCTPQAHFPSMGAHSLNRHGYISMNDMHSQHTQSSIGSGPLLLEAFPRKPTSRRKASKQGTIPPRRLTKPVERPKRRKGSAVGMHELAQNRMNCLLCEENRREVLMVPCRHLCICRRCSVKEDNIAHCPLCKCAVAGRMLIF